MRDSKLNLVLVCALALMMAGWSGWHGPQGGPGGGVPVHNVGCPAAAKDVLVEGCAVGSHSPAGGTFTALNSSSGALNGTVGATTPAAGTFTNLAASGTNSITDTSANGSSKTSGVCIDGICSGAAFGMAVANSDNSTNLQSTINAAYETGTGSATRGRVLITPDSTGGTTYTFTSGVDFKDVPVECTAGRNSGNSPGTFNITLNFTATSGLAIVHAGTFKNCRVIGAFTAGSGLTASITSIVDGANNQATVTTSAANSVIAGSVVVISGTTNYNGVYPVASVTDSTHFVVSTGQNGTASESAGSVKYYPTVGVMATSATTDLSSNAVDWENLFVQGFGADFNASSIQTGAGSINGWNARNLFAGTAPVGFIGNGNGFPVGGINSNVSGGTLHTMQCSNASNCFYCGPMVNTTSDISDSEEDACGDNDISKIDFESSDNNSADSGLVSGIWVGAYGNWIHDNYVSVGSSGGAGQTAKGSIRTADDVGPNWITNNRVTSQATGLVLNTGADEARLNVPGISANQAFGLNTIGGVTYSPVGQTPNLISATCNGSCATAGSGGNIHIYALVGIGQDGNRSTISSGFICPDGLTFEASGGKASCPAGNVGPTTYGGGTGGTGFMTLCYPSNLGYKAYDLIIDDNVHSVHTNFAAGSNGNNCITDTSGSGATYSLAPPSDRTGGINEVNANAVNHFGAVVIASLPATCSTGDWKFVSDWNATIGTCTGGGTTPTIATCGASNTWFCP